MSYIFLDSTRSVGIVNLKDYIEWDKIQNIFFSTSFTENKFNQISINKNVLDDENLSFTKDTLTDLSNSFFNFFYSIKESKHKLKITNSWFNDALKGQEHHKHLHPFSILSGVVFLENTESNLNFTFHHKIKIPYYGNLKRKTSLKTLLSGNKFYKQSYQDNLDKHIIIFMSNIKHSVSINESNKSRKTLSFNTFWTGRTGTDELLGGYSF